MIRFKDFKIVTNNRFGKSSYIVTDKRNEDGSYFLGIPLTNDYGNISISTNNNLPILLTNAVVSYPNIVDTVDRLAGDVVKDIDIQTYFTISNTIRANKQRVNKKKDTFYDI